MASCLAVPRSPAATTDLLHCKDFAHLTTPTRGDFWILKIAQGPIPESAAKFCFGPKGRPRPLGDVASFENDTHMRIRIC